MQNTRLHPYTVVHRTTGRSTRVLAANHWHAIDQGMLIFGFLGGIKAQKVAA